MLLVIVMEWFIRRVRFVRLVDTVAFLSKETEFSTEWRRTSLACVEFCMIMFFVRVFGYYFVFIDSVYLSRVWVVVSFSSFFFLLW